MYRSIASAMVVPAFFLALPAAFAQTEMSAIRQQRLHNVTRTTTASWDKTSTEATRNFRALDRDGDGRLSRDSSCGGPKGRSSRCRTSSAIST